MIVQILLALILACSESPAQDRIVTSNSRLAAGSEVFILQRVPLAENRYALYGEVTFGSDKGKKIWLLYDVNSPTAKIFTNELKDMLAQPTLHVEEAYYLFATEDQRIITDETWWVQTLAKLPPLREDPSNNAHKYEDLEIALTATGRGTKVSATDTADACPSSPQQRNGKTCLEDKKKPLGRRARAAVLEAARTYNIHPALLAGMIQKESGWDPFSENEYEKVRCQKQEECSDYKWSKGLGQFGSSIAKLYGLDWSDNGGKFRRPKACADTTSEACFTKLESLCQRYTTNIPISCPRASIFAAAKHLKDTFPSEVMVWVKDSKTRRLQIVDILPELTKTQGEMFRSMVSYFHRGARVFNSYSEHFEQTGLWPNSYGAAWATQRINDGANKTPSTSMGYQMLNNEFVNRCHIWSLMGLCGSIPPASLVGQYMEDFKDWEDAKSVSAIDLELKVDHLLNLYSSDSNLKLANLKKEVKLLSKKQKRTNHIIPRIVDLSNALAESNENISFAATRKKLDNLAHLPTTLFKPNHKKLAKLKALRVICLRKTMASKDPRWLYAVGKIDFLSGKDNSFFLTEFTRHVEFDTFAPLKKETYVMLQKIRDRQPLERAPADNP